MTFVNRPTAGRPDVSSLLGHGEVTILNQDQSYTPAATNAGRSLASAADIVAAEQYRDLDAVIAEEDRAFWCFMNPRERPSFTAQLLQDLTRVQSTIKQLSAYGTQGATRLFDYVVLGSRTPGVFSLGGDLVLFRKAIESGEREHLRRYAHACVEVGYNNHVGYDNRLVTIALVQGDALGGGMESALSCDIIVAERGARFGLPEVLFNLFPGMGAYSFLSRRIGPVRAEEMILSGRVHTAEEMHALGLVQVLAENGAGETAVREYIARHRTRYNAHSAVYEVRRRVNPVTLGELRDVTDLWVEAALRLSEQDLRKMGRLAAAQDRSRDRRMNAGMLAERAVAAAE
jgi:DSF synthase